MILMMLHETPTDVYRIAEHAKRLVFFLIISRWLPKRRSTSCLTLLHEHPKREELLDVLIDAGESAWARGAHEVRRIIMVTIPLGLPAFTLDGNPLVPQCSDTLTRRSLGRKPSSHIWVIFQACCVSRI